jgi:hypothetical protein
MRVSPVVHTSYCYTTILFVCSLLCGSVILTNRSSDCTFGFKIVSEILLNAVSCLPIIEHPQRVHSPSLAQVLVELVVKLG